VRLLAVHDGYVADFGVRHWRGVAYRPGGGWFIWDRLEGYGSHDVELNWHIGVPVLPQADDFRLMLRGGRSLGLRIHGGTAQIRRADEAPIAGWCSNHYGTRTAIDTICVRHVGPLPCEFISEFRFDADIRTSDAESDVAHFRSRTQ
jgi:hypothetical protein